jgi:hypothetical protein
MPLVLIIIVLPMAISASRRAEECGIEPAHPNQQLDEPCIRFFFGKPVGAIDPHRDLPPGAPQPYRPSPALSIIGKRRKP